MEFKQDQLVTLKQELDFIDSYVFLQKTRLGDFFQYTKKVSAGSMDKLLPPMTIQVVVENALKHNTYSEENPLNLIIESQGEYILIKNTYHPKRKDLHSTGLGQKKIVNRYRILGGRLPQFFIEDDYYHAKIPLLTESPIVEGSVKDFPLKVLAN